METLLITKLTVKSYLQCISVKKLFSLKTQNTMYNYQGYPSTRIFLLFSHDVFTLGKFFISLNSLEKLVFRRKKETRYPPLVSPSYAVTGITNNQPKRRRSITRNRLI